MSSPRAATVGQRVAACLIDVIPMFVVSIVLGFIPILGWMASGFINAAYWLLRDINGASLGKMALGLRVVAKDGSESTQNQRIMRNVTLTIGPAIGIIPLIGWFLAVPVSLIAALVEVVMLLTQNERLGDRIAGTAVLQRAEAPANTPAGV